MGERGILREGEKNEKREKGRERKRRDGRKKNEAIEKERWTERKEKNGEG